MEEFLKLISVRNERLHECILQSIFFFLLLLPLILLLIFVERSECHLHFPLSHFIRCSIKIDGLSAFSWHATYQIEWKSKKNIKSRKNTSLSNSMYIKRNHIIMTLKRTKCTSWDKVNWKSQIPFGFYQMS